MRNILIDIHKFLLNGGPYYLRGRKVMEGSLKSRGTEFDDHRRYETE